MLYSVLVWLPPKLLENASVALEDLPVYACVLGGNLRVEIAVLHLDLHVVCNGERSNLVWQIAKGLKVSHPERVLDKVLFLVRILVKDYNHR